MKYSAYSISLSPLNFMLYRGRWIIFGRVCGQHGDSGLYQTKYVLIIPKNFPSLKFLLRKKQIFNLRTNSCENLKHCLWKLLNPFFNQVKLLGEIRIRHTAEKLATNQQNRLTEGGLQWENYYYNIDPV